MWGPEGREDLIPGSLDLVISNTACQSEHPS